MHVGDVVEIRALCIRREVICSPNVEPQKVPYRTLVLRAVQALEIRAARYRRCLACRVEMGFERFC